MADGQELKALAWVLQGAKVAEHLEHPRQFSVITPTRTCYLRVKDREKRGYWVKAIQVRHPTSPLMSSLEFPAYIWCTKLSQSVTPPDMLGVELWK